MANNFGGGGFPPISGVVKNLMIINALVFIATAFVDPAMPRIGEPFNTLQRYFSLFYFESEMFRPFQIITSMFAHSGLMHFAFNMMTLFFLGPTIERALGAKRFLILYLISGLGASVLHTFANFVELQFLTQKFEAVQAMADPFVASLQTLRTKMARIYYTPALGASGSIAGVMMALGMLFPNVKLSLMFIPAPIKAKNIAIFTVIGSLIFGLLNFENDYIAHFAHLGGLVAGYLLLRFWKVGYLFK